MPVVTTSQEVLCVPSAIHVPCVCGREDKAVISEHLLPYFLKLFGMWDLSSRQTSGVYTALSVARLKSLILFSRYFYLFPFCFLFSSQNRL